MNNKALLGFFVVLFLILTGLYIFRDRMTFGPFRALTNISGNVTATPSASIDGTVSGENPVVGEQPATGVGGDIRVACRPEMFTQDCSQATQAPVCGYERIVSQDGTAIIRSMDYISACHYCKLYAPGNKLEMGDETVYPLGYEQGACTQ